MLRILCVLAACWFALRIINGPFWEFTLVNFLAVLGGYSYNPLHTALVWILIIIALMGIARVLRHE